MSNKKLSRRDAMKMLGAAIGGAALSTVPPKWSKPALAASQLPAHARQSAPLLHVFAGPYEILVNPEGNGDSSVHPQMSITPPDAGIQLHWQVTGTGLTMQHAPKMAKIVTYPSGTLTTDSNGEVYGEALDPLGGCGVTMEWSFVNPAEGVDTATQEYLLPC